MIHHTVPVSRNGISTVKHLRGTQMCVLHTELLREECRVAVVANSFSWIYGTLRIISFSHTKNGVSSLLT